MNNKPFCFLCGNNDCDIWWISWIIIGLIMFIVTKIGMLLLS